MEIDRACERQIGGRFLVLGFDDNKSNEVAMFCQKMQKTSSVDEALAFDKRE